VQALLRGQGLFPLRAAPVRTGHTVALAAGLLGEAVPTLAAAWERGGGTPLDESVLLWSDGQGVRAGAWPELPAPATGSAASPSLFVDQPRLSTVQRPEPHTEPPIPGRRGECRPDVLLFLLPSAGHTRLEPLLTREALASLVSASPLLFTQPELAAAHLETLRAVARQCCCYRLFLALGPRPRAQALSRLLPAIARSREGTAAQP
jgi:hypothetical protein